MGTAYIDNDILHKFSAYGLLQDLLTIHPFGGCSFFMLGAARYIVRKKLQKKPPTRGIESTLAELDTSFSRIIVIEPAREEINLAAELEFAAQKLNVDLDPGESMLCAAFLIRGGDYIYTGDKRAVYALQALLETCSVSTVLRNRVACLEQLLLALLDTQQKDLIRSAICAEPLVDKTLTVCFSCRSENANTASWKEGLLSYIKDLHKHAPMVLFPCGASS